MSTERNRSDILSDSYQTALQYKNGVPRVPEHKVISHLDFHMKSMTDHVIPFFHKRIARGDIINNPCLYEEEWWQTGSGFQKVGPYEVKDGSYTDYVRVDYQPPYWSNPIILGDFLPIDDVGTDQGARQSALAHVNVPAFDFGEDTLELLETIRFIKNPLKSLTRLAKSFQKKGRKATRYLTGVERAKALADVWASYSFAARPLIQSIQKAVDAYTAKIVLPPRLTSRGIRSFSDHLHVYNFMQGGSSEEAGVDINVDVQREFRAGILYTADTSDDLSYRLGFRLRDWPSTLWEVLPLSFMVDRVLNIQNTINGIVNLMDPNVKILAAWVTEKSERTVFYQVSHYQHATYSSSFYGDPCTYKQFRYQREVWIPGVNDLAPAFTPGNLVKDVSSTLDLLAILTNRLV